MSDTRFFRCASCAGINRIPLDKVSNHPTCGRCKAALAVDGHPQHLSDDELDALVASSPAPVLVDFYADWCGPCRSLAPTLEALASKHAGRLFVVKVDTEVHGRTAQRLAVSGIPAVFVYQGGAVVAQATGNRPLPFWDNLVAPHL